MGVRLMLSIGCLFIGIGNMYSQSTLTLSSGSIRHIENFKSEYVTPRNIDVWMPNGYSTSIKYDVVYMHDGQMLFDSTQAWNRQEWGVDETFSQLINNNSIDSCIVVGIWNTGNTRISEYMPNKIFSGIPEEVQHNISERLFDNKGVQGDNYLKFLVSELKPYIDTTFSTLTEPDHTFIVGSSMGGLISLYAICEYPDIFGGAASLSTSWLSSLEPNYAFPLSAYNYLSTRAPSFSNHNIYMDYGTAESDSLYATTQLFINTIMKGQGYTDQKFASKVFENAKHCEKDWGLRLNEPIRFLMPKPHVHNLDSILPNVTIPRQ